MDEMSVRAPMATPATEGPTGKPTSRRPRPASAKKPRLAPRKADAEQSDKGDAERPALDVIA